MLCKKAASMIIGISMDQEICLFLGQVSLSSLLSENPPEGFFLVREETDKTASGIQAWSFMTLERNVKER